MAKKEKTFLDMVRSDFGKIILGSLILNVLFLVFGIIIFMNAQMTIEAVGVVTGIYFISYEHRR